MQCNISIQQSNSTVIPCRLAENASTQQTHTGHGTAASENTRNTRFSAPLPPGWHRHRHGGPAGGAGLLRGAGAGASSRLCSLSRRGLLPRCLEPEALWRYCPLTPRAEIAAAPRGAAREPAVRAAVGAGARCRSAFRHFEFPLHRADIQKTHTHKLSGCFWQHLSYFCICTT